MDRKNGRQPSGPSQPAAGPNSQQKAKICCIFPVQKTVAAREQTSMATPTTHAAAKAAVSAAGRRATSVSTRITNLLGCQYPVLLPGMSWISTPSLVAAVCNAGGVGILATGPLNVDETRNSIAQIRELAPGQPFGIGATLLMPGAQQNAEVALEEQVPIINVSLGKAQWIADGVHEYGGHLLSTVTNAQHAQAAVDAGTDALMLTGHEAAAHGGKVTSLCLIPALRQRFPDMPLVAAGGFANGAGLAAALALGADAVAMGSRLAVSTESALAHATKEAICQADETQTIYGKNFDGIPARVLATPTAQHMMQSRPWLPTIVMRAFAAARQLNMPLWKVLPGLLTQWDKMFVVAQFGAATQAITAATVDGDLDTGVQFIGQSVGLIDKIESVDDIVQRIMQEASDIALRNATLFESADQRQVPQSRAV